MSVENGPLKHLFNGKTDIVHHILFNIDVNYILQQVHSQLVETEYEETMNFIDHSSHLAPRKNV